MSRYLNLGISCILTIYIKMINSDLLHRFGLLSQSIDINYDCGLPNPIISTIRFQNLTIYVSKMLVLLRYRGKISVEGHTMKINNLDESLVGQYTILFVSTGDNGSAVEITASVSAIQDLTIQYTNSLHQDSRLSPNRPTCTSSLLVTESTVDTMIEILKLKWDLYSSENLLIDDQVFQGMAAASTSPVRDSELKIFLMRNIVDYNFTRYDNNRKMRCALQDNYNNSLLSKEVSLIVNFYPELDQLSEETIVLQNYTGTDIIINCGISSLPVAQYTWRHIIPKSEESAEIVQKIGHERQIVFRQELPGVYNLSCTADQDSKLLTQYVVINLTSNLQSLFGREGLFSRSFYIIAGCLTVAVCLIVIIIVTTIVFLQSRGKSKNAHQSVVKSRKRYRCGCPCSIKRMKKKDIFRNLSDDSILSSIDGEVQFVDPVYNSRSFFPTNPTCRDDNNRIQFNSEKGTSKLKFSKNITSPPPYSSITKAQSTTQSSLFSTNATNFKNIPGSRVPLRLPSIIRKSRQNDTFIENLAVQV